MDLQRKMSVADCERWSIRKRDQMTQMRDRVAARAKAMGSALEGTRSACVSIPSRLRAYEAAMFKLVPVPGSPNGHTRRVAVVRA